MSDITAAPKAELQLAPYFKLTSTGLQITGEPTYDEWAAVGETLKFLESSIQFALGDWLRYGERKWGEKYAQAVAQTGKSEQTLTDYVWVASAVEISSRNENLTFAHHKAVAPLRLAGGTPDIEKQRHYLELAQEQDLSVSQFRKLIQRDERAPMIPLPTDKYRVIYADPPWQYGNTMPDYFTEQADHYTLMTLDQICQMPVREMCEENAVLFLWVTSPILEESFEVVRSWGFQYKASFVWDKIKHNMGHYNSVRHEILLVCTRGSCQPDVQKLFDSVVSEERTEHSKKPESFRQIIDTIYPHGKRIELFARVGVENWDCYGNEIPR
jgi:N6-adenosine-specific RNA methylase IME4